jgi:hypothetical protein
MEPIIYGIIGAIIAFIWMAIKIVMKLTSLVFWILGFILFTSGFLLVRMIWG